MTLLKRAERRGRTFLNPVPTQIGGLRMALKVLPQYLRNKAEVEPKHPLGPFSTDVSLYNTPPARGLRVTWFGHSSSLIEIDGFRVLIDPVWDPRASPFRFLGPKRFFAQPSRWKPSRRWMSSSSHTTTTTTLASRPRESSLCYLRWLT